MLVSVSSGTRSRCDSVSSTLACLNSSPVDAVSGTRLKMPSTHSAARREPSIESRSNRAAARREQIRQGIDGPLDQLAERVGPFLQEEIAGIEVRRQGEDPQIQLASQEKFQRAVRRGLPGLITVEDQHDHAIGQPQQRPEVVFTQGRAQGAHDVRSPT